MSIEDKIKNAKESHLFDELSEKEKFEAIVEARVKVRLIAEFEKIKAEIIACTQQEEGEVPACINYGIKLSTEIVEKHISKLKGENK